MSSIGPDPSISRPSGPTDNTRLEFSVFAKNPNTGQWETIPVNEVEQHAIGSAIKLIQNLGEKSPLKDKLNAVDSDFELTKEGIYVGEGVSKNLLKDRTFKLETSVKNKITSSLTHLTKTISQNFKTPGSNIEREVKIHVHIHSGILNFDDFIESESAFREQVEKTANTVKETWVSEYLKAKGVSGEEIKNLQEKTDRVVEQEKIIYNILEKVQANLKAGNNKAAIDAYTTEMPKAYAGFCDALRNWESTKKGIEALFPSEVKLDLDSSHYKLQPKFADKLLYWSRRNAPGVDTSQALSQINKSLSNYEASQSLAIKITAKFQDARVKEAAFNREAKAILGKFNQPAFRVKLLEKGWSTSEIDEYVQKLISLENQSNVALKALENAHDLLRKTQDVQECIDSFSKYVYSDDPVNYINALKDLVVPQKLARGRMLTSSAPEFELPLNHTKLTIDLLRDVAQLIDESKVVNAEAELLFKATDRSALEELQKDLDASIKYPSFVLHFNYEHKRMQESTSRIRAFNDFYQNHRELLEYNLRNEGFSDLESSRIFNHYVDFQAALENWNRGMQHIVDLANSKEYEEAFKAYINLIKEVYPELHEANRAILSMADVDKMNLSNDSRISRALKLTAEETDISSRTVDQWLLDLSTNRFSQITILAFKDAFRFGTENEIQLPENTDLVLEQIDQAIEAETLELDRYRALTTEGNIFDVINSDELITSKHRLRNSWLYILDEKYKFPYKEAVYFNSFIHDYAALVKPLKDAQLAIEKERDPQKKIALQAQYKELAVSLLKDVNKLNAQFKKRGGMEKLESFVAAVDEFVAIEGTAVPKDMQFNAHELISTMRARLDFLSDVYTDLGLLKREYKNTVSSRLLQEPHLSDPRFTFILNEQDWDMDQIQALSKWTDAFFNAAAPLRLAKRALDADPENPELQREFNKVAIHQFDRLNSLSDEFNKKFGVDRLEKLEKAITKYRDELRVNVGTTARSTQIAESLQILSNFKILEPIQRVNDMLIAASDTGKKPLSWDSRYLRHILPSSPEQKAAFARIGLKESDRTKVLKLFNRYQEVVEPLMILERQLGAKPADKLIRQKLFKEIKARGKDLDQLKADLEKYRDIISKLDRVASEIENIRGLEPIAEAFRVKQQFVDDLFKRFVRKPT